ncbi:MAG: AI-2E family transporter [Candidatus Taylorbacteria bacterium]|nr:AI-2E family transporter [Candidatus Taylorbacteria bacterium]
MDNKKLQLYFFIGLLFAVFVLALALFKPFIAPIALAFMAAIVVKPLDQKMLLAVRGRRTLAAILTVVIVLVIILVPLSILVREITVESLNFYADVRDSGIGSFSAVSGYFVEPLQRVFPEFNPDVEGYVRKIAVGLVDNAQGIFSSTASLALGVFVATVALYYLLRDGHSFRKSIIRLSPLADAYDTQIMDKVERAVNSVVRGSLFTSLIKGVLAALGFAIFGVPHAILWGALTAIVSLLPGIGAGLTIIPAALYLVATDAVGQSIGLLVWGFVVVGLVDNVIMPIVVGKGATMHPLFVLLSVIGGLSFFGPIGLFLGPLVIALLSALLEIYKLIILDDKDKKTISI